MRFVIRKVQPRAQTGDSQEFDQLRELVHTMLEDDAFPSILDAGSRRFQEYAASATGTIPRQVARPVSQSVLQLFSVLGVS